MRASAALRPALACLTALALPLFVGACKSSGTGGEQGKDEVKKEGEKTGQAAGAGGIDMSFLLTMSYEEAQTITPQHLELPPFYKLAADEIEIVSRDRAGKPRRVRARGKVFLQMDFREPARALGQEAYIDDDEVILRGRPMVQRGGSVVEGMDDNTVFYMLGLRLRVIGLHRVTSQRDLLNEMQESPSGPGGSVSIPYRYRPSPLPRLGPWETGPNPLLPPLSPSDVPESIRREMQKQAGKPVGEGDDKLPDVIPLEPPSSETKPVPSAPSRNEDAPAQSPPVKGTGR